MKICVVSHAYPRFAGDWHANFVEELAVSYAKLGEVAVFVPFEKSRTALPCPPQLKLQQFLYLPRRSWHIVGSESLMKQDLKPRFKYLVHMSLVMVIGTFQLARLMRRESFDLVHAHWGVPSGLMAVTARFLSGSRAKVFSSFPGSDVSILRASGLIGRLLARILDKADLLACNSRDLREDLEAVGIRKEVALIIYGVNDKAVAASAALRATTRTRLGLADDDLALLMVGRFVPKKGFATGLHAVGLALRQNPKLRLYLIGQGDELQRVFEAIVREHGMGERVSFLGSVAKAELPAYYSAADIFLMPSIRKPSDGLNVVVPEAMACGLPILASEVGGNDLVVVDGTNGYLHKPEDAEELSRQIVALSQDEGRRVAMGKASLQLIRERFNWDAIAQEYLGYV